MPAKIPRNLHVLLIIVVGVAFILLLLFKGATQPDQAQKKQAPETVAAPSNPDDLKIEFDRQNEAALERERKLKEKEDELKRQLEELEAREKSFGSEPESDGEQQIAISEKEMERREAAAVSSIVALRGQTGIMANFGAYQAGIGSTTAAAQQDHNPYQSISQALAKKPQDTRSANEQWLERISGAETPTPIVPVAAHQGVVVHEGTVIPAVLQTKVDSSLPGMITARVKNNVYDTQTGMRLAIPAGSRLVGKYNSATELGQRRIMAAFHRIILPDGRSLMLKGAQGAGAQGASGIPGDVNNHFLETLGSQLLIAAVAWFADSGSSGTGTTINISGGDSDAAGEILTNVADKLAEPYANMKPTLYTKPGDTFNVMVNRDILVGG